MAARQIPGYTFDPEKGRYFRIQPDHAAAPGSASKHTKSSVREAEESSKRRRLEAKEFQRTARERVRRCGVQHSSNASSVAFSAETGLLGNAAAVRASRKAFVGGLRHVRPRYIGYGSAEMTPARPVEALCYDQETCCTIIAREHGEIHGPHALFIHQAVPESEIRQRHWESTDRVNHCAGLQIGLSSRASSLSITPSRVLLATTYGSSIPANVSIYPLDATSTAWNDPATIGWPTVPPTEAEMHVQFMAHPEQTVFTSSPNRYKSAQNTSTAVFAVGSSGQASIYTSGPGSFQVAGMLPVGTDVLSCDWQDANVLTIGTRRGEVVLWDTRMGSKEGSVTRFSLPMKKAIAADRRKGKHKLVAEAVSNLHCLDGKSQMVIRGGRDVAGLFDLRTLPAKYQDGNRGAQPVVHYAWDTGHLGGMNKGFDVSDNLNVAAIADETGNVGLFDVQSGDRLRILKTQGPPTTNTEAVQCLRWIERWGKDVLLGARGKDIVEWAW